MNNSAAMMQSMVNKTVNYVEYDRFSDCVDYIRIHFTDGSTYVLNHEPGYGIKVNKSVIIDED